MKNNDWGLIIGFIIIVILPVLLGALAYHGAFK